MEEAWQRAPEVTLPALVVYAANDQIVPSRPIEGLVRRMGTARAICHDAGFHMLLRGLDGARVWREILNYILAPAGRSPGVSRDCAPAR
jgi:alpha-beta hydrolase superfamily lysophospholipase